MSWLERHPEAKEPLVGIIQAEHMGENDYREVDGVVEPVGLAEQSYLWSRNNPVLIDAAIAAAQEHGWERVQVAVPERPGINDGLQQVWWGVGSRAQRGCATCLDLPRLRPRRVSWSVLDNRVGYRALEQGSVRRPGTHDDPADWRIDDR